jgi:DNA-binding LytR/AlgR family response regulator
MLREKRLRLMRRRAIRHGSKSSSVEYVVVSIADVDWIEADGNYAKLYVQRRPRIVTRTLTILEQDVQCSRRHRKKLEERLYFTT